MLLLGYENCNELMNDFPWYWAFSLSLKTTGWVINSTLFLLLPLEFYQASWHRGEHHANLGAYPLRHVQQVRLMFLVIHLRSRDGAVVRALASHQCGPGSIPGLGVICGLSLLLVLVLAP